jgi:uncharacterized protein YndB with AHSA1/START domain
VTEEPVYHSQIETLVLGTPEQVWEAIATGPGITAWFVPAEVADGKVTMHLAPGETADGEVTASEPPHRFAYVERWKPEKATEEIAFVTEFLVEARSGGACVVRIVSSGFGGGTEWADEMGSLEEGWGTYLDNLRLYLSRFPGQRCTTLFVTRRTPGPAPDVWRTLSEAVGIAGLDQADVTEPQAGLPPCEGMVERVGKDHALITLDAPLDGQAVFAAHGFGDDVMASVHFYLFGPQAAAIAERDEPAWHAFLERLFPA